MKTFRTIGVALLTVLMSVTMFSCGDDDNEDDLLSNNPLIGTWIGGFAESYGGEGDVKVTMTFTDSGKMTCVGVYRDGDSWNFKGTYKVKRSGDVHNDWMISFAGYFEGEDEYYDDDVDFEFFYINGNQLTISFDGSDYLLIRQ